MSNQNQTTNPLDQLVAKRDKAIADLNAAMAAQKVAVTQEERIAAANAYRDALAAFTDARKEYQTALNASGYTRFPGL